MTFSEWNFHSQHTKPIPEEEGQEAAGEEDYFLENGSAAPLEENADDDDWGVAPPDGDGEGTGLFSATTLCTGSGDSLYGRYIFLDFVQNMHVCHLCLLQRGRSPDPAVLIRISSVLRERLKLRIKLI